MISCDAIGLVAPSMVPGSAAQLAAETDNAAFTQTAAFTAPPPSLTVAAQPTNTLTVTPTLTPTLFLSPTSEVLSCKLLWQSPRNGVHYDRNVSFNAGWSVSNTGTVPWDPASVSFVYVRGTRMYRDDHVAVPASVAAGGSVVLTAPLRTPDPKVEGTPDPNAKGTYTTVWSLRRGRDFFCAVSLTINVP